ncbi:class F sortase [Streptacidiphilus sp. 4-A2]|nr:class F sortase [Streptacidiphilus sp. 4-A2]
MTSRRVKRNRMVAVGIVGVMTSAGWLIYDGSQTSQPPQPIGSDAFPIATASAWTLPSAVPSVSAGRAPAILPMASSAPTRIKIPTIDVNAPVIPLGQDAAGHLQTPPENDRNLAGWYSAGPAPGSAGNAVMDGHVDTRVGPAVFYNLGALRKKDPIEIDRRDGTVALFTIDAVEVYRKNSFPDQQVYGPSHDPELHVITCGGAFSKRSGYQSNVVVYAHMVGRGRGD